MADNDNRRKLYDNINKEYDLPDYNQFSKDMEDDTKRKKLYDAVAKEYDLPDYNKFSQDMGYGQQTVQTNNQQTVQQSTQTVQKPQVPQTPQIQQTATADNRHAEKSYDEQKAANDKQFAEIYNKLAKEGRVRMGIENHPNVKMVAVTDDLIKKFPILEQSRGYQVPFDMNYGTPIMQNLNDKGDMITPEDARDQYTKILTGQDFDYVPLQETAAVQVGNVYKNAVSTKGGWLDRAAQGSLEYAYGKDWKDKKYEIDGKEIGADDMYQRMKQELYDDINKGIGNIRQSLLFATDEERKEYVDGLYNNGYLSEKVIPKATVLHYVNNVGRDEQVEELKNRRTKAQVQKEMIEEKLNVMPQQMKGESDKDFYNRSTTEGALYKIDLRKLDKQINQYDAAIDELEGRNTSAREWKHAFKTSGILSWGAWDFGATDLEDAIDIYPLARKVENGRNMSQADYISLKILSQENDADAVEGAVMPSSYNIKKGGLVSAPFILQFMAGGEFAKGATTMADKAIARTVKGAIYKAAGKKALSAAERLAEKAASNKIVSLVGMLGKDFRQAFFMENTTGAATTGAEILNRRNGTVTETGDGFDWQGETLPMAIYKGEMSQNIELQTEFLGEHFPSSLKFIRGMAHTKVGSAMGLRNMAAWLSKLSRKDLANTIRSYATKGGINGLWGEYMEEVAGTAENAMFVGDQKLSDLVDAKQQWETFGSVALSCIGMGIFGTAVYTGQRGLNMPRYYQMKHLQNKWDNTGLQLFSGDEWAQMKEKIDNTPNENAGQLLASIVRDQKLTEEQARAAFNYARCMLTLRGMNIGTMKAAQLGLTDDKTIEQDQSYVEGRETSDEDKHDVQIEYEDKTKELAGMLGISEQQLANMSDEELESLTGNDDKLDNVIYDYQNAHAKYQGVIDNADDNIDMAAQQAARQADMVTDKSRGTVRNATIKATKGGEDYGVYIVSGNIATNEDGSINVSESDNMILYYDPQTGKIEHADASRFAAIGEEVNAEEAKNQAIADAKEKAIRKEAGIIDGTVGEGSSFTITDADGNEHTYEVLADNGDGTAMITLDGNVQDAPASLEDLQKLKDAEDAKKLEAAKLEREQHEKERELQREKDNAPVEDNLDYSEVINNDGKIEIADVINENGTSMFPDAQEVFFIQNQGNRAKVMVLDNEGNLKAKMVKKSAVVSLGTMSVDEYKEERQQMLKESGKGSETSSVEEDRGENENLQPIGKGTFGNIYNQFKGKVKEAFNFLISHKSGDLLGVFHRDDVGDIDLVWGNDKMGLAHIIGKHIGKGKDFENIDDAINIIDEVINKGGLIQDTDNRYVISLNGFRVGIRKNFDGTKKNWIVTAIDYNRSKEEKGIATNPTSASHGVEGSELAAPNDSQNKDTLWERGANETSTTDAATASVTTNESQLSSEQSGSASHQSNVEKGIATNPTSTSHGTKESESTAALNDSQGKGTSNESNKQENSEKITLEDGTEVPMKEDGNPDFSQLTAKQTAELYDTQFGEDAEQIISDNVSKSKKALDNATNRKVTGSSFAEQKASKEAKDKAIAEAQEKYDSAKAVADAYNERQLAKEEDTPEGRQNLIDKARRKFNRMKSSVKDNAQAVAQLYNDTVGSLLHRLYDGTGIDVFDDTANTVEEYVASHIAPYSLNYDGTETSKGVKQETGLSRTDFAKTGFLAKEGKGKTIDQFAHDLWRDRPENLQDITDQDVRNAIIDLITSGETAFSLRNHIQNMRIAEAENILKEQKRQADELAYAEQRKEEEKEQQPTGSSDNNTKDNGDTSDDADTAPSDDSVEDNNSEMPFDAPSADDAPFSAKDETKEQTPEERQAFVEKNRVNDIKLVDDVIGKKLRKSLERIARMMGAKIQWQRTDMKGNGWFNSETNTIYLTLDSSITEGVQFIFGHEMTHEIKTKSPAMYDELKELVKGRYGEDLFEAMTDDNEQKYTDAGIAGYDRSYYEEETVADAIGEMINDLNLAHSLALKMSHPLLAKMHDVLLKVKTAFFGTEYSDAARNIIRSIEQVYVKTANGTFESSASEGVNDEQFSVRDANERFNNEIKDFKNKSHKGLMHLGAPSPILKVCGVDVDEITISPKVLNRKLNQHSLEAEDIKDLVNAIQRPIMVYKHGEGTPNIVVITNADIRGNKLSLALELDAEGNVTELNNVSSIHDKDAEKEVQRWLSWNEGYLENALRWVDKEKVSDWLSSARLNSYSQTEYNQKLSSLAKVLNDFKNPNISEENVSNDDEKVSYSLRQKPEPEKKGIGYKVFVLGKDGKLYPPMVANPNGAATPVGVWLDADAAPIAGESKTGRPQVKQGGKGTQGGSGKLAYRPGWHLGVIPYALQFNRKDADGNKTLFPKNFVFAEVEYAADKDYQEEAHAEGINANGKYQHSLAGLKHLPTDGYYMYRTNPNLETDPWVITGAMKVNRLLTRAEQAELVRKAGREPQKIQDGDTVTDEVVNSINQEIANAPKFSLRVYHGSGADFTEFDFDHMGEGAGSQAFGWGGYVTSSKEIGKSYADVANMSSRGYVYHGDTDVPKEAINMIATTVENHPNEDVKEVLQHRVKYYSELLKKRPGNKFAQQVVEKSKIALDNIDKLDLNDFVPRAKNLYEVNIPDDNGSNYLDWDAPLSDELIDKVANALPSIRAFDVKIFKKDRSFEDLYRTISMRIVEDENKETNGVFNDDKAASKFFSSLGFTGIKYKAGRNFGGAEEGDLNYVIFKPEDMKIAEHEKFSLKTKPEANMKSAIAAMQKIVEGADFVPNAVVREDLAEYGGDKNVGFYWGKTGNPHKNFKGGFGLAHIGAKHGEEVVRQILDVLCNGKIDRFVAGNKTAVLTNGKFECVLALTRNGNKESWLLSGWDKIEKAGGNSEVSTQSVPMQGSPTFSRTDLGAALSSAKIAEVSGITNKTDENLRSEPKFSLKEIKPIGVGAFGNIYDQFKGKAKAAIDFLRMLGGGEAIAALHHKDIGDIDLVWGKEGTGHSDGFGLAKLIKYHPEVLNNLQEILDDMHVISKSKNRVNLESDTHKASVRLTWDGERKSWLLTAFKKETSANDKRTDTAATSLGGDTALSQTEGSAANVGNSSQTSKKSGEKFSLRLQKAIFETDTEPTDAQKKSGNYKKGHVKFGGYDYTIENPKGSYRSGVDENGKEWKQKMHDTYGYIRGTFGKDGDHLDMFINDKADLDSWNGTVYIVDQVNKDGSFDEHKVMYGYDSLNAAKEAYLSNYEKGWTGLGNISAVEKADFDKWLDRSNRKLKPFADYKSITSKSDTYIVPNSFEEFLEHPVVRFSIRNERERAAAKDAYNYAQENRPDKYSQYAIVDMDRPGAVPEYMEKKKAADNWRRYYNKMEWGNYKLFDLNKPFEDNVKNLVGKFPNTFRKENDTTLSRIKELTADYNNRKTEYAAMSKGIQEKMEEMLKTNPSSVDVVKQIQQTQEYKDMISKYQELMGIRKQLNELKNGKVADDGRYSLKEVNDDFNKRLHELVKNPNQKDKILRLGRSSSFLKDGGIVDAEIELDFDKLMRKSKQGYVHEHPFNPSDVKNLPMAIARPISVFYNTNGRNDGHVILTELKKEDKNFIVAVQTENQKRKGGIVLSVNKITTLFPKDAKGVINWFNQGKATNIDKEKTLHFIEALQNHYGTTIKSEELLSAANIVRKFESSKENGEKYSLKEVNDRFNEQLKGLTRENADKEILSVGNPSSALKSVGIPDRDIRLYGNKILKKAKVHSYSPTDLKDLPNAIQRPIAIFDGSYKGSYSILTELQLNGENALASIDINKGEVQDINLITSVYGKRGDSVLSWINSGKMLYTDKKRTLDYISSSAPIADATHNREFSSAANIVRNFENPKENGEKYSLKNEDRKQAQLDIILKTNPMLDDYHTGIRKVEDIKTLEESVEEARNEAEMYDYDEWSAYPDITNDMLQDALETGEITIYSSKAIKNGVFVTPSYMQASDYAGGGKVFEKTVPLTDVAWINTDEGQYAKIDGVKFSLKSNVDNQGNPLNDDGTLKLDKIRSVDELTDEDFLHPSRNIQMPTLPKKVADAIGVDGKPVIIKKNIFERNFMRHKDVTPEQSKAIFNAALYNPDLYGQNQKNTRPYNWVLINTKDEEGKNRTVLLEVNPNKDNVEIVHWHFVDERGLEKIKKQADREDGQLLILPSNKEEVGALSDPTINLSAANVDNSSESTKNNQEKFSLKEKDAEYLEAVRNGDMEKAQEMVDSAARAAGYVNNTDYQGEGSWNAPSASVEKEDFANLDALRESVEEYSGDTNVYGIINGVTTNDDDFYYNPGRVGFRDVAASETSSVLRKLRYDKSDADTKVKVYRAVPTDVRGNKLMSGDWIALSQQYCIEHGNGRYGEGNYRIIEEKVPIKTIWNDGNDMREFGYDDGNNHEAEKNVPNNRKLLDAVTYDDEGNVIPLSERFNENNADIRYSLKDSKADRIRKLRESKPVAITGKEIIPSDDLKQYKKNALEYGKSLRGIYRNEDTGEEINLTGGNKRGGIREILQHDYKDIEHLQSIAAIPQLIKKSVFMDELPNEDKEHYPDVKSFRYYVCGLKIGEKDYTVKAVVAEQNNGNRYYDHRLTEIEKGKLLSILPTIQKAGTDGNLPNDSGFDTTSSTKLTTANLSVGKDKRLLSILQTKDKENANSEKYSLRVDRYREELNQWKRDNNLPKDAERPQLPIREPNESAADFLKRVKEYRQQAALWATAPKYEQHLLTSDTAQGQFNLEMQRKAVLVRITLQDSMLAIRKAQEAIMKEAGVDKLNFAEDAYTAENRSHGKGKNEFEEYNDEFLQPLRKAYNDLMKRLGKSYDNVKVYMVAKHGLERNAHIAFKKALDEDYEKNEERMNAYNSYKADIYRLNNDADFERGRINFATWKQRDVSIRTKYAPSYSKYRFDEDGNTLDYSGLTALFDVDDFESAAADLVKEVEDKNEYYTDELWYATNAATRKILKDSYKAGMMTEDIYNFVRGMYNNYIPLRGWGDTNADQVWNYVGGGKGSFSQVVKEAKGRKSLADDPIAYIENMAESGILMNNRNWVKQHLLLLAENHPTSLLNVSKAWYIKTTDAQGNEEWIPASPQITAGMTSKQVDAALEAFEKKMEQMAQKGDATQKRAHLEISYPQTNGEEREHEVRVMKNGEEYVIYINGDPQLAQAMNNTRARKVREGLENSLSQRVIARTGRYMAAAYTSLSPLFIPSNYMRDLTMTLASTAIREDARYNYLLRRNMLRHWNTFALVLRYQNGTLREKVRNGSASRVEEMFYDFMMNGGETGFVTSVDVEELKKKFRNELKDMNRMAANPKKVGHIIMESIETLNRAIEDSNRFMIYMTSIEYGRSIDEAVNNAKDVTLNFNRKGTGEHGWQTIRNLYLFINPAIQSLQTLGALAKHHPFKFTAVTTAWMASGVLVPLVNNLLMSMFGGDDDKDKYWQFTKWDRRNNFIMWVPFTHEFVKIPLAQEFRGFYGLGDMIASKLWGGEKAEESWSDYGLDLMGQIVDMLPLDPTGYDGNVAVSLMPNPIRPFFELAFNVDFTGKPLFKDSEYNKYDPNFTKAYVGTPEWLVRISRMVNNIGNDYPDVQQNWIDRAVNSRFNLNNPAVVDHVLSSYLGGAYTMGSQTLGVMTKALNGDEIKMADIPLASKFVSNPDDRPVSKKQGDEFWNVKERFERAANTLSKLKKKAKVDGDYSTLDIFFGSNEYRQYKEDDKVVKKYEEDREKEKAQETGEEYKAHKTTGEDVYKAHTTPKDDFEDMKMKQLYEKLNSFKIRYEVIDGISREKGDAYYRANKAAIEAVEDVAYDRKTISDIKKGFLNDGKSYYDADGMTDIRELRRRILDVLERANRNVVSGNK